VGHALTRTVRDSAALLDVVAGGLPGDPYAGPPRPRAGTFMAVLSEPLPRLRIGWSTRSAKGTEAHADARAAVERVALLCEDLGHEVVEGEPRYDAAAVTAAMATVMGLASVAAVEDRLAELGRDLADDDLEPFTRVLHDAMRDVRGADLVRRLQDLERVSRDVARFFGQHDLWLSPTVVAPVPPLGWLDTTRPEAMFERAGTFSEVTAMANVTGQPAMSVPAGVDADGLPVGVQLTAAHNREGILLQLALQLESAMPWPRVAPWPPPA
jgi:amidase